MCRNCRPDLQLRPVQNIGRQAPPAALQTMRWIAAAGLGAATRLIAAAAPELEDVAILPPRQLRRGIVASLVLLPRQLRLGLFRHAISFLSSHLPLQGGGCRAKRGGWGRVNVRRAAIHFIVALPHPASLRVATLPLQGRVKSSRTEHQCSFSQREARERS